MPHLYVIGSMKEMGTQSDEWHRRTGEQIPLKAGSEVFLVGQEAAPMAESLHARGFAPGKVHLLTETDELRERIAAFRGAVFLKGSRALGLEKLVPEGGVRC